MIGDLIQGTGGVRKWRYRNQVSKGKSGGVRVVHFYFDRRMPVFLLTVFGKGKKTTLSKSECNELRKLTKELVASYRIRKQ